MVSEISEDEKLQTPSISGSPILYTQIKFSQLSKPDYATFSKQ